MRMNILSFHYKTNKINIVSVYCIQEITKKILFGGVFVLSRCFLDFLSV